MHRRKHACTLVDRVAAQNFIQFTTRQHGQRTRHVHRGASRASAAHMAYRLRLAHDFIEHPQFTQSSVRVWNQAIPADFFSRKFALVHHHHVPACAGQFCRCCAASRPGPDNQYIATFGKLSKGQIHGEKEKIYSAPQGRLDQLSLEKTHRAYRRVRFTTFSCSVRCIQRTEQAVRVCARITARRQPYQPL